ncbi:ADP-ribosylglycohydrolase family protein [Flavobacterium sp.]|uniref:ADP-ribosylglycohydrolase family protein n=1 Tax=Flavobacterium sp. TaxID=239 RepID=UPI00120D61F2|nr:ADP-ribosylglycohydrolase family protein [Flavobacterium sp.]RZJ71985.1 MAG: ADP-ribosylglycohydrolase family protein [Flavobacterium sp.]
MKNLLEPIRSVLFGVAVADALGVPVEFKSRQAIALNPVTDMIGYGTYNLPPGTFSDDSSMTFCLAEALTQDFNMQTIADNFVKWKRGNFWTPRGQVFDIGIATSYAIDRIAAGTPPVLAGGFEELDNGNGSLMRISPLFFYTKDLDIVERFECVRQVSSITHGHIRSIIACFYYLEFMRLIFVGKDKFEAYFELQKSVSTFLETLEINPKEIAFLKRLLNEDISKSDSDSMSGSGYVLHSLESSIWCLLTTESYKEAVLKAVNLGDDTDTTAAITGGIAGLLYGFEAIPTNWVAQIARYGDIEDLCERLSDRLS